MCGGYASGKGRRSSVRRFAVGNPGEAGNASAHLPLLSTAVARAACGGSVGGQRAGGGAQRQRCDRAGHRRLPGARHRPCRGREGTAGRDPHGHAGRAGHLHARDRQGDPRQSGSGGRLRGAGRRAGGERRHLHPVCLPRRGDGAGHQSRRGHAGADRRATGHAQSGRKAGREEGQDAVRQQ
ncbi:hypothetical protein D9M71_553200 [compost metagenome]